MIKHYACHVRTFLRPNQCNFKMTVNNFGKFDKEMYNLLPENIKCPSLKKKIISFP